MDIAGEWQLFVTGEYNGDLCSGIFDFEVVDYSNEDGTDCALCIPLASCDDNDDCTINDQYDEDCNCRGTIDFDFEIVALCQQRCLSLECIDETARNCTETE